jgi:hypothetical protein
MLLGAVECQNLNVDFLKGHCVGEIDDKAHCAAAAKERENEQRSSEVRHRK